VTDAESKIDDELVPELIATHFLSSVDEVIEHVRAASVLGFGIRLHSYLKPDSGVDGAFGESWELELLTTSPVRDDEEE
jgi:hypothetical protein